MAQQHSRRPGAVAISNYSSLPDEEDNRGLSDKSVGGQVLEPKHVYSRQPAFSTPTLSMNVQLPTSRLDEIADPMYYGHEQTRGPAGSSTTLSSSVPSGGIYRPSSSSKSGLTPRADLMRLAGSGSTLTSSTPSSGSSSSLFHAPPLPYDQHQHQFPLDWSYGHQTYSPFPTSSSGRLLETVSPTVDTSAFLLSPTSAEETIGAKGSGMRPTSTLSSPGMHPPAGTHYQHLQHINSGYDTAGLLDAGSHDMMMDGLSPNSMAFRGLGLEHDETGLGSMPMMMGGSSQFESTTGIGLEIPSISMWNHSACGPIASDSGMASTHHAPSYHQDVQQHQDRQQYPQPSFSVGYGGEAQQYSHFQSQSYNNLPVPDHGVQNQQSRSPLSTTQQVQGTDQPPYAVPTQHVLPPRDFVPNMDEAPLHVDRPISQPNPQPATSTSADGRPLFPIPGTSIDPAVAFTVQGYLAAPNKYAFGERRLVIHSPRVGQKSYGTEKRFICPPPVAVLYGRSWWTKKSNTLQSAPVINISITDETRAPDVRANWHTTTNRYVEEPTEFGFLNGEAPFVGKACGKALHISDTPARKAKSSVQALVTIMSAVGDSSGAAERRPVVGTFESKPITIVSKPSKKRQNTRNSELFLQHGTPVSLYNRIRSQTSSTKYLSVATDITRQLGSDGKAIPTHASMARTDPAFVADQTSWNPLLIWLVDPQYHDRPPPVISGREAWDGYAPPSDIIRPPDNIPVPVICYNNTVRLQCPSTGLTSPVLVIRRVDNGTTAYGGEGAKRDGFQGKCPMGELTGEPVSQLHKIALELYAPPHLPNMPVYGQDFRYSGQWMTAEKDRIEYRLGKTARTIAPEHSPPTPRTRPNSASSLPSSPNVNLTGLKPLTPRSGPLTLTPTSSTMALPNNHALSGQESFGSVARQPPTGQGYGNTGAPYGVPESLSRDSRAETNGLGPIRRRRTNSNASVSNKSSSLGLSSSLKSSTSTMSPPVALQPMRPISGESFQASESPRWFVELAETATWTIVGAETKVYTFWVNPDHKIESPLTPLPLVERCVPPGQNVDMGRRHAAMMPSMSTLPQATIYGDRFTKDEEGNPRYTVWWGTEPAEENEYKCTEVMAASIPRAAPTRSRANNKLPIALVRQDGMLVVSTALTWTR